MRISCIVAMNDEGVIGLDNKLPWHLPADLKFFKKTTLGHHVLMGRNCYESIGRPLPSRTNIIISRNPLFAVSGCYHCQSVEEGIRLAMDHGEDELFIIGGGMIYEASRHLWHRIYLTRVDYRGSGDVFFPEVDWGQYRLVSEVRFEPDEKNPMAYSFEVFDKKI